MAEFVANTMVLTWINPSGTLNMSADFRTATWSPSVDFYDGTAGSDTVKARIVGMKDATASISLVNAAGGTIEYTALDAGVSGTLIIQPEGTATNKRKITFPCFSNGAQYEHPYNDVATLTCAFTANGAYTDGVNT